MRVSSTDSHHALNYLMHGHMVPLRSITIRMEKRTADHPGKFAVDSHIPLFVLLPLREGIDNSAVTGGQE